MATHFTPKLQNLFSLSLSLSCLMLGSALNLAGQRSAAGIQSSPEVSQSRQGVPSSSEGTTPAFIGYVTNGSIVFPDIATSPGPLSTARKFKLFVNQSISPPYIFVAASGAAFDQARNLPKGYGQGWGAYGSRFGSSLARASSSSFFGSFLFASWLHQDPRFFPESKPSLWRSLKYSMQRIVITRNDSGKDVFNISGLLGPLAAEGLANAYLPSSEQTIGRTVSRFATGLAWQVGGTMFKDYWPTFFRTMGLNRLKVVPDPSESRRRRSR